MLPAESAELRAVVGEYANLHVAFGSLEDRRAALEAEMSALLAALEVARNREAALKRGLSDRLGEEVELMLPVSR